MNRLAETMVKLADRHHCTITNSRLHDPGRIDWTECPCRTCVSAQAALDRGDGQAALVTGVWLRTKVNDAGENENEVLVEVEGVWRLVISEPVDGIASHIVEASGIEQAPVDV